MNEPQRRLLVGLLFSVGTFLSVITAAVLYVLTFNASSPGDAILSLFFVAPLLIVSALVLWLGFFVRAGGSRALLA
jgi:hypothetical protein